MACQQNAMPICGTIKRTPFVKYTFSIFLSAALVSLAGCAAKQQQNAMNGMMMEPTAVRAVPVTQSDVPLDVSAVGNVESMATVDVKSRVAGQVLRVCFQEGQTVSKGELLFEIDPELIKRQIAEIQANLSKDLALEDQAKANVAKDEAQIKQTRAAADRGLELAKEGIFSREQTEQVVATNDSAKAALDADKAAIESATASINADRARLAQTELQLAYTKITAPITGRAGAIGVKAGNLIKDNDAVMVTLLQMSPIYVTFGVPEQLLADIRRHNAQSPLEVAASAQGQSVENGLLKFIDNQVDSSTGTIKLKAEFENKDGALWPGEFVSVQTRLALERDRIVVPSRVIQSGPQGKYVWVLNRADSTVAMRPVDVVRLYKSANMPEESIIGSGLKLGEQVISEGQMRLMPGVKVNLLKQEGQLGESGSAAHGPA
jgi:multidrug efflux system membrane fusion protein